jgi:hypothetical protein
MQNNEKLFTDSSRENAFALKRDGSCLRLLGDEGSFEKMNSEARIAFLHDEGEEIDPEEIYDGGFVFQLLNAVQSAELEFFMKCPRCGTPVNADNVCLAYTPSAAASPYPDSSAVCIPCNREICFCGDEGWFNEDFNHIALATVERIRTPGGEDFFRKIDDSKADPPKQGSSGESRREESVLWQGSVYDLVWGSDEFCRTYRRSLSVDDAKMSRNSEIAYDLICAIGQEIR